MAATCQVCKADLPPGGPCPKCLHVGAPALDLAIAAMEPDVKLLLADALRELVALSYEEVRRVVEEARAALVGGRPNAMSPALGRLFVALQDRSPKVKRLVIAAVLQTCANRIDRAGIQ